MNIKLVTISLIGCLLAACAANEKLVPDPTYKGNLTLARLQDTDFTLEDSADVPFDDLFVGFEPSSSPVVPGFPRSRFRFDIGLSHPDVTSSCSAATMPTATIFWSDPRWR